MMKRVTNLLFACLLMLVTLPAQAQTEVTVREIHNISQDAIDELYSLGASMTQTDLEELVASPLTGETVTFTAVVLAEPVYSGRASVDDDGLPGRVHFFVRDTSAASEGPLGMDIQIVDGAYQEKGLLGLFRGDVVTITGDVTYFDHTLQITPETVEFEGDYASLGLPESILEPVSVATSDLNMNMGGTSQQAEWSQLPSYNHAYVRIEGATVWRSPNREEDRPQWAITSDGASTILMGLDTSLCYRNDQDGYPDTFNQECIDNDFVAPLPGAVVNVEGFVLLDSDFDPFDIGTPDAAYFRIAPWEQDDLVVTQQPSITSVAFDTLEAVPGDAPIDVTLNVEGDADAVTAARLIYQTSNMAEADTMDLADQGSGVYTAQIPAQDDGTFVWYSAVVTDDQNTDFSTPAPVATRVLFDGIDEIADIQETWIELGDASAFTGQSLPMSIDAVVQSSPSVSGFVVIQDAAEAWSGIMLTASEAVVADLARGDSIRISNATVIEPQLFGQVTVTELDNVTYEKVGSADAFDYEVLTTNMLVDDAVAEAYEGMMVRFEDAHIIEPDAGFGEWSFSSDGTVDNAVLADDQSDDLSSDFNDQFTDKQIIAYMQGVWWHSFGDYKLVPETASDVGDVTNVAVDDQEVPGSFALEQNYPNPFNPSTSITFSIPQSSQVRLEIFDMLGRSVQVLVDEQRASGTYEVAIDGTGLSSGVYLYRLTAGDKTAVRKMLLMK